MKSQTSSNGQVNSVPFQCSVCSQTFGKIQHLKRHKSTHVDKKPHFCEFCGSEFTRSDTLRRHWKNCTSLLATGNQVPQRARSGKRKRACDRCTERKRACNQGNPCAECTLQESECTYIQKSERYPQTSVSAVDDHGGISGLDVPGASEAQQKPTIHGQQLRTKLGVAGRCRFNFLLKFTRAAGINEAYNCNRLFVADDQHDRSASEEVTSPMSPNSCLRGGDYRWPTFRIESCSPLLLANMVLMGGCISPYKADRHIARSILDITEAVVFSQPMFSTVATRAKDADQGHRTQISTLQATYLICIMQKWEGSNEAKIRIQRDQFTKFVSATREMGLSRARQSHRPITSKFSDSDWRAWIQREEVNRMCNYVFLLDSAFVILHNSFPRMVLQEMQIDLTSPESWFQASSSADFLTAVQSNPGLPEKNLSLVDSVRRLCNETPTQSTNFLDGASELNLFTIATAIHGLIFHQRSSLYTLPLSENPLGKALDRWEVAWKLNQQQDLNKRASRDSSHIADEQDGFMHYANEFAVLARVSLELSYFSPTEWSGLVEGLSDGSSRGAFATFDQTGMGPVGDLMLAVENLSLNR
ncbi:putative transcription factor with C2H2 and Zn(2)-Cys(6) DNA binding [Penicillium digitatum]|uniref:Putative transcription factor with C2H2 and Zn(2)-Cys(6) DNA binding n=1 Tax=Penicillium digitatum TaxID=36651 RepID=A0A7T6XIG0_PENDI|nr:putative transcription factor with C2H2 and Zn(2)-Cys(6) DNA binding [Penicillium digitatum]